MRRVRSRLARWAIRSAVVVLSVVALAVGLLVLFEQRWGRFVVEKSIEALNAQLAVPVSTSDVSFTFFRNFPHASLHLRNVFIPSLLPQAGTHSDTLLLAESVYLVFNPIALLGGHYRIERCQIVNGYLYLRQDEHGNANYSIFRSALQDSLSSSASLALNRLALSQIAIAYRNEQSQVALSALVGELQAGGAFSGEHSELAVRAEGLVEVLQQGEFVYAKRQHFTLASHIISSRAKLTTPGTELVLDRNHFHLEGSVDREEGYLDLRATGREIDLRSLLGFASQFQWQPPASVDVKGRLNASLTLVGHVQKGNRLRMQMELGGENLSLRLHDMNYSIPRLRGRFSNGEAATPASTSLELTECLIKHRGSSASILFSMKNLVRPIFYTKFSAHLLSNDVIPPALKKHIIGYKSLNVSGELLANLRSLDTVSLSSMVNPRLNLQCGFDGVALTIHDSIELHDLSGSITLIENDLAKSAVSGKWGDVIFSIGASGKNALAPLLGRGVANWTINASLEKVDFQNLIARFPTGDEEQEGAKGDFWTTTSGVVGSLSLANCSYGGLKVESAKSNFTLHRNEKQIQILQSSLLNGNLEGNFTYRKNSPNRGHLMGTFLPTRLDLKSLLHSLNNFGQQALTSENVAGKLSGSVSWHVPIDSSRVRLRDLQVNAAISVEEGALTDMKGLDQLASFIALEDLRHIRFSTLSNTLSLRNQRVVIPKMNIHSSALSLSLSGEHQFNSAYHYRIALRLSDLLFNRLKSKRRDMQENALANEGSGGHSLFLVLEGDSSRSAVRFDHAAFKEQLRQKIEREKETLETMLQEEFGNAPSRSEEPRQPAYTIEWEEVKDSTATKPKPPTKKQNPPKRPVRITWDE